MKVPSSMRYAWGRCLLVLAAAALGNAGRAVAGDEHPTPSTSSSTPSKGAWPSAAGGGSSVLWRENFRAALDWRDPQDHSARLLGRVYAVQQESGTSFLHGHHDATAKDAPPALHLGKAFENLRLHEVRVLRWRWRARIQPLVREDPWLDMAAGLYVVIKTPSFLRKGRGFKFGWLARPGPVQTFQRGLLQVPLRSDPPSLEWRTEEVDVCALYRQTFGPCEGEHIVYIGVVTDADGTKSIAEGDYTDFEIGAAR
jgi:hypothetical protein